ncbi:unnamed protein product [Effrenium voratum]|uniref:Serine/threonine specific protein phosphatases domain-containing protein n=1 Tax=Effrenium voratum TaxID=2562239 RepID=A0AA36J0T7_9DINO|nr:unnamed protein product [Effrenium voratum]
MALVLLLLPVVNALRERHGFAEADDASFCLRKCCRPKCNDRDFGAKQFRFQNCTVKVNEPIYRGDKRFCEETCTISFNTSFYNEVTEVKAWRESGMDDYQCYLLEKPCHVTPTCSGQTYELRAWKGVWQFQNCSSRGGDTESAKTCAETCTVLHTNEPKKVLVKRDLLSGLCRIQDPGLKEYAVDFVEQLEKTALTLPTGRYRELPLVKQPSTIKRFLSHLEEEVIVPEKLAAEGRGFSREITARHLAIIGDLHGQLFNLIAWLIYIKEQYQDKGFSELEGSSLLICDPQLKYVFLGDYVDRGERGLEVLLLLLAYKARCPEGLVLLQGNHESPEVWDNYGFKAELWYKVKMVPYTFRDVVRHLPYVAVVPGKYMFVHGGLSPQFVKKCSGKAGRFGACLDEATAISVTWADPHEGRGWVQSPRGRGVYKFGVDIAKAFLDSNNLHAIWRGHEQMEEGSSNITFDDHYVFTIFSSADYVGVFCLQGRRPLAAPPWDRRMFAGPGQNNAGGCMLVDSQQNLSSSTLLQLSGDQARQLAAQFTGAKCAGRSLLEEGSQVLESPDLESPDLEIFHSGESRAPGEQWTQHFL